jgi:hypothetical protein
VHRLTRTGGLLAALAVLCATAPARADGPGDVQLMAHASVETRFVPDPKDATRDLVTGRQREDMETEAQAYYTDLLLRDPARFELLRRRTVGERSADELAALARHELASGRPVAAELAWQQVAYEHPDSPLAGPSLVQLASSRQRDGDLVGAAEHLSRLPELDLRTAAEAEPLMQRLLAEIEADLAREGRAPDGRAPVRLHPTIERLELDRARELSEWTSGWSLADEVARTLRLETSGDVLRVLKNVGADAARLNALVVLIPREERVGAIRVEEMLRDGSDPKAVDARVRERTEGRKLDKLEDLARLQQLQLLLLARALEDLLLDGPARRLGEETLVARRELCVRLETAPHDAAVSGLVVVADANGDGKLSPLLDDEGLWRPRRFAVEGDMRNARVKPLDDDNKRAIADLFERTGMSEKGLLQALVRACREGDAVSPERVATLLTRVQQRGAPVYAAAYPKDRNPEPAEIQRDYIARLNVLRGPGEGLDDVLRREVLDTTGARPGGSMAALTEDPRAARLVAELASLGTRWNGAWLYEDDPPREDGAPGRTADQKLQRATEIHRELDDVAAAHALDGYGTALVADLESLGLRFRPGDLSLIQQRIQHEDLGTLALSFDELGNFTHLDEAVAFTEPGTRLGEMGPGHLAYGFGLDVLSGAPGANAGWRDSKKVGRGTVLRYHVGATGLPLGPTDTMGASARFRTRRVWQPEIGADASVLRGLSGRGFFNLIRDVNVKHRERLARLFWEHEEAKKQGRDAFVASVTAPEAEARPAALFTRSLGYTDEDLRRDTGAYLVMNDSYELEKARQKSMLNRDARKVRFAGFGFTAAFLGGQTYLLAGPKFAVKDFRLFSRFVDGAERRVQSEEAETRRVAVSLGRPQGRTRRETLTVDLDPTTTERGAAAVVAQGGTHVVTPAPGGFGEPREAAGTRLASAGRLPPGTRPEPDIDPVITLEESFAPGAPSEDEALASLSRALQRRGVPLDVRSTGQRNAYELVPVRTTPWSSQSYEIYAAQDDGLGLSVTETGRPLLVAPAGAAGVVLDWMEEVRAVTRSGESDETHRVVFSRAPGRPAAAVIESSAAYLRCEVVGGRTIGTARILTRYRDDDGAPVTQGNVILPQDADAPVRLASLRMTAAGARPTPAPDLPRVTLHRPGAPGALGSISEIAALDVRFIEGLEATTAEDLARFKERGIAHAHFVATGAAEGRMHPDDVAYIQSMSLAIHGRPLSGDALDHAHYVLTHRGLYRADGGPVATQVRHLEERAVTPFGPGREMEGAFSARTGRLMRLAGVDERAALDEIQDGVRLMAAEARRTGSLPRETLDPGCRIVTASWGRTAKGVQWTTATVPTEAHLLAPLALDSNAGRYVTALALGPDLEALDAALRRQLADQGDVQRHPYDLERDLVPAIARALASPASDRTLVADVAGLDLTFTLASEPRAGALARCKNATLFPPAYGAKLKDDHGVAVAAMPAAFIGVAEADTRFVGENWVGWRRVNLLAGGPWGGDDKGSPEEPEPEPLVPPRDLRVPPVIGRPPRLGPPDRPTLEAQEPPAPPGRDGAEPPDSGRVGRGDPPDRPGPGPDTPPGDTEPRDGTQPVPPDRGDRPTPPAPPDRPRRPVD